LDEIPISQIEDYEDSLQEYVSTNETKLLNNIQKEATLTEEIKDDLDRILTAYYDKWIGEKGLRQ
jgi:F0F1-type ATP synthase alpha subunit